MFKQNPLTAIDAYKIAHFFQTPSGCTEMYTNMTPRFDKYSHTQDGMVMTGGIRRFCVHFLLETFNENFFQVPKKKAIRYYQRRAKGVVGFKTATKHLEKLHDLGYLPIRVKALPEGTLCPMKVPLLTFVNTHPDFAWLPGTLESVMSAEIWKVCTSATVAFKYRKILESWAKKTGCADFEAIPGVKVTEFQGHDFSFRGMSGIQDAAMSGIGHLMSFKGSDNLPSIDAAEYYYDLDVEKEFGGLSIPATEHSVTCLNILMESDKYEGEKKFITRNLTKIFPKGVVGMVSDSYDFWGVLTRMLPELKDLILNREGKLVIRPDSGDPVEIICGVPSVQCDDGKHYRLSDVVTTVTAGGYGKVTFLPKDGTVPVPDYERKGAIEVLWDIFGGTETETGHKVLDSHIGLIYGDSITLERCEKICRLLEGKGFASCNVVFGIGSYTYQYATRDTYGFAVKCTHGTVDGEAIDVYKDPKTDTVGKKSAKGYLRVDNVDGTPTLVEGCSTDEGGMLETVFEDSKMIKCETLAEIRKRVENYL